MEEAGAHSGAGLSLISLSPAELRRGGLNEEWLVFGRAEEARLSLLAEHLSEHLLHRQDVGTRSP